MVAREQDRADVQLKRAAFLAQQRRLDPINPPTLSRVAFDDAVAAAMTAISNADVRACATFAGYSLGST